MNKNTILTAVISAVGGAVVGGGITYVTVKNKLEARYALLANSAIADVKRHYALLADGNARKVEMLAEIEPAESDEDPRVAIGQELVEQYGNPQTQSALVDRDSQTIWDHAVELDADGNVKEPEELIHIHATEDMLDMDEDGIPIGYEPIEGEPHLIGENYYFENPQDYELDTLTYYEVDDTLVDEHNNVIERVNETIGGRHLNIYVRDRKKPKQSFYVKNEEMETLFEVIMSEESYSQVVLGIDPELLGLKEPKQRPKRMRKDDD